MLQGDVVWLAFCVFAGNDSLRVIRQEQRPELALNVPEDDCDVRSDTLGPNVLEPINKELNDFLAAFRTRWGRLQWGRSGPANRGEKDHPDQEHADGEHSANE